MNKFPELLKKIRKEAGLNQQQFAEKMERSKVLISMIESGQKDASKDFIKQLASKLQVQASSITPFLYLHEITEPDKVSPIEKKLLKICDDLQEYIVKKQSHYLKND